MAIKLGSTNFGQIYLGSVKIGEAYYGATKVFPSTPVDPYNPLNLPAYTIRLKFQDGVVPSFNNGTATRVSSSPNVWDLTYENADWTYLVHPQPRLIEVLGANTRSVTNMSHLFEGDQILSSVALFDTRSVTDMSDMFNLVTYLRNIPLFDTRSVTNMTRMFKDCILVQSGALALYQQASTQATPPSSYSNCFTNCGSLTVTGAQELAQIPASWGGTGA